MKESLSFPSCIFYCLRLTYLSTCFSDLTTCIVPVAWPRRNSESRIQTTMIWRVSEHAIPYKTEWITSCQIPEINANGSTSQRHVDQRRVGVSTYYIHCWTDLAKRSDDTPTIWLFSFCSGDLRSRCKLVSLKLAKTHNDSTSWKSYVDSLS